MNRDQALAIADGARARGEDVGELVVMSFDPAVPELVAVARNLFASALVFTRSAAERSLGPWIIGLPREHALALLEAQALLPPVTGFVTGAGDVARRTLAATLAARRENEVLVMRLDGALPPRVAIDAIDLTPPPPVDRRVIPRWRLLAGPGSSIYGVGAGDVIHHDSKMVANLRRGGFTMESILPHEVRRGNHHAIEWLTASEVEERTKQTDTSDLDAGGYYLVRLEREQLWYWYGGRNVVVSRESTPQMAMPGDQIRAIAEQCAGPILVVDAPGGPRRLGMPHEVIVPACKEVGPDEWIETTPAERDAWAAEHTARAAAAPPPVLVAPAAQAGPPAELLELPPAEDLSVSPELVDVIKARAKRRAAGR
ncbi:MAG: hypothetical protein HYV09_18115 [Deltaproteobacteria bacterium]|nr:hypothetical protein [Deltaproteobacteria bacterium]